MEDQVGALRVGPSVLTSGDRNGPNHGATMVVKDLLDVEGIATGAGNPDWLADATPAPTTAPVITALLAAGFDLVGKSHTDELAFSLSGTNVHYGTPHNTAAPGRIPGGSSSGSAAAVAAGLANLGVGTDTGGSIRVPAAYCRLFGWRPTHGRVGVEGCIPLAPTFDTIGLLARDAHVLAGAARHVLDPGGPVTPAPPPRIAVAVDLLALADREVADATVAIAGELGAAVEAPIEACRFGEGEHEGWLGAFRSRQLYEAWQAHGGWITRRRPAFGPGIAERFAAAARASSEAATAADRARDAVRRRIDELTRGGGVLVIPAAATVPPPADLPAGAKADLRHRTMLLTCIAGLAGAPSVTLPNVPARGVLPGAACIVGRPGDDERLLAAAAALYSARRG